MLTNKHNANRTYMILVHIGNRESNRMYTQMETIERNYFRYQRDLSCLLFVKKYNEFSWKLFPISAKKERRFSLFNNDKNGNKSRYN